MLGLLTRDRGTICCELDELVLGRAKEVEGGVAATELGPGSANDDEGGVFCSSLDPGRANEDEGGVVSDTAREESDGGAGYSRSSKVTISMSKRSSG